MVNNGRIKEVTEDMGMLKSISLENYKCFKEKTDIDIAPLTVLCGVNSSGKSSILKSLLMLKQTAESNNTDGSIIFSGDLVDCGIFNDVVYNGEINKKRYFTLRNSFKLNNHRINRIGKFVKRQDAKDFNELRRMYFSIKGTIKSFVLDTEIIINEYLQNNNEFMQYITNNEIKSYKISISAYDENDAIIEESCGFVKFEINENRKDDIEPHLLSWDNIPGFAKSSKEFSNYICSCSFNGLIVTNVFAYEMQNNIKGIIPNILTIYRIVANQYNGINYIAPLRNNPQRTYIIKNNNTCSVGINGENTSILLAKIKNEKVLTDVYCPWTNKIKPNEKGYVYCDYYTIIQQWLEYFEMDKLDVTGENGTISLKIGNQNISDVGFGLSQILPIITQGIYMDKEQTLLIEQPEIHLHPKMELQMADFLIRLAETGRNIIIETHSDYIKDRIILRILEDDTRTLHNIISMNFIEHKKEKESNNLLSKIVPITIKDDEGIKNSPDDFFDQGAKEQLNIIRAGLLKRKKISDNII